MMRRLEALALLALLLPAGAWAQIDYQAPSGAGSSTAGPFSWDVVLASGKSITLCNTADCVTNYEQGALFWSANVLKITTSKGGTGAVRSITIDPAKSLTLTGGTDGVISVYGSLESAGAANLGRPSVAASHWLSASIDRAIYGSKSKALTESSETGFAEIPVAQESSILGEITYEIKAADAVPKQQVIGGRLRYSAVNETGTVACTVADVGTPIDNTPTGTLTVTWTCAEDNADKVMLKATAVSSLTQTTLNILYRFDTPDTAAITPQ
jgi:hypothetical protein